MLLYIQCGLYHAYICHCSYMLIGCGCMLHGRRVEEACHAPYDPYISYNEKNIKGRNEMHVNN